MASDDKHDSVAPDGIPMQKANTSTWIAVGVGAVVVIGLAIFSFSGSEAKKAKAQEISSEPAGAPAEHQMTAKEHQAHLLKTQKALAAAEHAEALEKQAAEEAAAKAKMAAEEANAEAEASSGAKVASRSAATPKTTVSKQQSKKKMDSLDSLGADITSALK